MEEEAYLDPRNVRRLIQQEQFGEFSPVPPQIDVSELINVAPTTTVTYTTSDDFSSSDAKAKRKKWKP